MSSELGAIAESFLAASSKGDLHRLREMTTPDVLLHAAHPDLCCVGQDAYCEEVWADHQQVPFKSLADIRVEPKPWGLFITAREKFTILESGESGERHRRIGLTLRGQQVSEVFDCTTPWGTAWKKGPPSRFEMRYIGGWPGLDSPIDAVTLQIRDGFLVLYPGLIPDTSLATHVLSGRDGPQAMCGCPLAFLSASNVGHGRDTQHTASGADLAWGALGGVGLVGGIASSAGLRADLSTLLGAATGSGVVAAAQRWVEPLQRIVIAVTPESEGDDPFWFVLEQLPSVGNDKRKLPPGSGEPLAMWDVLQRAMLGVGAGLPMRSMAGIAAYEAQATDSGSAGVAEPETLSHGHANGRQVLTSESSPDAGSGGHEGGPPVPPGSPSDPSAEGSLSARELAESLQDLKKLVDQDLLSDAEFEEAKAALLRRFGAAGELGDNGEEG